MAKRPVKVTSQAKAKSSLAALKSSASWALDQSEFDQGQDVPAPELVLVRTLLFDAIPTSMRRRIAAGEPLLILLETTTAALTSLITGKLSSVFPAAYEVSATKAPTKNARPETPRITRSVIVITSNTAWVSPALVAGADLTLKLRLTTKAIGAAIRSACGRGAKVTMADIAGLDVSDVLTAIRPNTSAVSCVERLRRAKASRSMVEAEDHTPELGALVGYGSAIERMMAIANDVDAALSGTLAAEKLPSILLYGPPGTGKTQLAKSFAKTVGLPLITSSVGDWFTSGEGHLGDVASAATRFFESAATSAPSVAFLDEIDAIPDRSTLTSRDSSWWTPVVTQVLLQIDKIRRNGCGVILIGATNHREKLDGVLRRSGRFDIHLEIAPPTSIEAVAAIVRHHLGDDLQDANLESLVELCPGATGAVAASWVGRARDAARTAGRPLKTADLAEAIAPRDDRSAGELRHAALHEAAHAIVARLLGISVNHVTIVRGDASGGVTSLDRGQLVYSREDLERRIVVALAGRAADELFFGRADTGSAEDMAFATQNAIAIHTSLALGDTLSTARETPGSSGLSGRLADIVEADLHRLLGRARKMVHDRRDMIEALADFLLRRRAAGPDDIGAIVAGGVGLRRRQAVP